MDRDTILDALPAERRDAVEGFLDSSVGDCPICGRPVTCSQPRRLRKDVGVCHLRCDEQG